MSGNLINKLTKDLIAKIITEFKKPENNYKINQELLVPLLYSIKCYINSQIYTFFYIGLFIFILNFIFVIAILFLIIKLNFRK
jgi:large-conductance mechanosensitive channel